MSLIAMAYLTLMGFLSPRGGSAPDLALGLAHTATLPVILVLQSLWVLLFLFYGRSQVTASLVSFHVATERM